MAAKMDLMRLGGKDPGDLSAMMGALSFYKKGAGFTPSPWMPEPRYFDDDAWIGLDFMQAYDQTHDPAYLQKAESLFSFMETGLTVGKYPNTGLYWCEEVTGMSRNICSNGPTTEIALRLALATQALAEEAKTPADAKRYAEQSAHYGAFAKKLYAFMNQTLEAPNGLYWDNIADDGKISKDIYAYNQATPIGADVLFYRLTHDESYLKHAQKVAAATLAYFAMGADGRQGFWLSPPSFNAMFFRSLLALNELRPDTAYTDVLKRYLDEAWTHARDPNTGFLTLNGIGCFRVDHLSELLDQSGFVQMFALLAKPTQLDAVA
jgi:uncharacterized protein YyaL (SSP411 family)